MVFIVFFKVFFLTVLVGMFHGLVYLPVMLAVFGSDRVPKQDDVLPKVAITANENSGNCNAKSHNCEKGGIANPEFGLGDVPACDD